MVLLEARGLSLFLVIRGGIACISDSVTEHTGPNSLTDTHLEPSVSRTRDAASKEKPALKSGLSYTAATMASAQTRSPRSPVANPASRPAQSERLAVRCVR